MTHVSDAKLRTKFLELDHLVLATPTLDAGVRYVESRLGVAMAGGGAHPHVATHNRLLRLGDCYLEVLARNPGDTPTRNRWFGLDDAQWASDASTAPRHDHVGAAYQRSRRGVATAGRKRRRTGRVARKLTLAHRRAGRRRAAVRRRFPDFHRMARRFWTFAKHAGQRLHARLARSAPSACRCDRDGAWRRFSRRSHLVRETEETSIVVRIATPRGIVELR